MTMNTSRRGFLRGVAATTAVLAIGLDNKGALAKTSQDGGNLTPFVQIDAQGNVTAIVKHFEMGQGTTTGLTSLIAEELNMTLDQVGYAFAPSDNNRYANLFFQSQGTGGSSSMANSFLQYRQAGAAARHMLLSAAAKAWRMPVKQLEIKDGIISGGGKSAGIGDFVEASSRLKVPGRPQLKDSSAFRVIGNPQSARKDTAGKINGTARYAMDVQFENQIVVAIKRTPRYGGRVAGFDRTAAQGVKGFLHAATMPNQAGVAVFAETTWAAFQARDLIEVQWDFSAAESRSSEQIKQELLAAVNTDPEFVSPRSVRKSRNERALEKAAQVIEQDFYFPMLAHAPMEPLTCAIEPTADGGVIMHDGCQSPARVHGVMSQFLQLPMDKIQINTLYAGGSFGRRATPAADYQVEAILAFLLTNRSRPLKLVWSREDDITGGYYRPAYAHKVRVGLDDDGKIIAWDHRVCGQSIFKGTFLEAFSVRDGIDATSIEGMADTPYQVPGMFIGLTDAEPSTSVNWWRAVGHTHTAYVMESMMDMAANAAGQDPVAFRLAYLQGGEADQARFANVLTLAAEKAAWGAPLPEGRARGVAVHKSFGSYVAQVVEVSRGSDNVFQIEKVTSAVDCGIAVNPDVIAAQVEGAVGYGIGHIMRNEISLENGEVVQTNFPDYEPLRFGDILNFETHIVPSGKAPSGIGEPGTPPSGPALANAIAVLGPRVTHLPMQEQGVEFA